MMMNTIGRMMFALPMIMFGVLHLMKGPMKVGMVPIPGGLFWVYLTGVALIAAGVAIIWGRMAKLASMLLGIMILIFALTIYLPGIFGAGPVFSGMDMNMDMAMAEETKEMVKKMKAKSMSSFLKDIAMAGGAFVISHFFAEKEE